MYIEIMAIYILIVIVLFIGIYIGSELDRKSRWNYCDDISPPSHSVIVNYPVAFFDDEFGVVIDQAEYHPNRAVKWLTVPDGDPCKPFAWYDLPYAPHPRLSQDMGRSRRLDDYI